LIRRDPSAGIPDGNVATVLDADLRAFVETLPQVVWRTTPEGLSDYFNRVWYEYSGLTPEESVGCEDTTARVAGSWRARRRCAIRAAGS
jgi:PAS domain-containing protein